MEDILLYFILSVTSIFLIINPISTTVILLGMTNRMKKKAREEIVKTSSKLAWVILIIFAFSGYMIFQFFGLTFGAFKIAGGFLLFKMSLDMIFRGTSDEMDKSYGSKDDLAVVPFTIPFTSGPGAIATTIILSNQATTLLHWVALVLAITTAILINYLILINSDKVKRIVKEKGMKVLVKIMGILVCSIGVQFIINGLIDVAPLILEFLLL